MALRSAGLVLVLALVAATFLLPVPGIGAQPGPFTVRGRVTIGVPVPARRPSAAYPTRSVTPQPLASVSELRHVIVFVRDAARQAVPPTHTEIRQRNETFMPRVVAVTVGSEVSFPNDDPFFHNVFSLSRPRNFNLGRYPQGKTRRVRFERPGIVKVFCDIHSHMSATVMVFDHPFFAVPDEGGRFELDGLPPGDLEITAWHERLGDTTQRVRVEERRVTEVEFVLPVPSR